MISIGYTKSPILNLEQELSKNDSRSPKSMNTIISGGYIA